MPCTYPPPLAAHASASILCMHPPLLAAHLCASARCGCVRLYLLLLFLLVFWLKLLVESPLTEVVRGVTFESLVEATHGERKLRAKLSLVAEVVKHKVAFESSMESSHGELKLLSPLCLIPLLAVSCLFMSGTRMDGNIGPYRFCKPCLCSQLKQKDVIIRINHIKG